MGVGAGFNMLDLGVQQGRALRPLEKAGRVGLGYEQTETETETFLKYFFYFHEKFIDKHISL